MQIDIILLENNLEIHITCLKGIYIFWYHNCSSEKFFYGKNPKVRICISNKFTGCADASGPADHTLRTTVLDLNHLIF